MNTRVSDIAALGAALRARQRSMLEEIHSQLTRSGDTDGIALVNHTLNREDWAVADVLADTDIGMLGRDVEELRDIEAALARIDGGTYGECADCGDDIPLARLKAHLSAKRCKSCQAAYEKRHGLRPGPSL